MAILALEPSVFPPDLLTADRLSGNGLSGNGLSGNGLSASGRLPAQSDMDEPVEGRCWRTVYTKSRQEKALARDLTALEIPFYLPLAPWERVVRNRRVCTYSPLFPGYLFFYGSEEERVRMLCTNRVSRVLPVPDGDQLYRDLQGVSALVDSGAPLTVESRIEKGRRVRVKFGSLMGLEGTVIQRRGIDRLLIEVNYIQQGVSIQVDDFMVETI